MGLFQKIFGSKNDRELRKLQPIVDQIASFEAKLKPKSDAQLKAMTGELKTKLENGASLDDILPEAYAVVREAGVRILGMRHYDVQMIGGIILHQGRIAEMRTGEGKTLVATLPTYLNALAGKGVHVVTVNDYLAKRDSAWMGRLHGFLGLSTGVVVHGLEDHERQAAYNSDITYGQNNEFGFDYLRDNMKASPDRMVQRGLNYAVVDEVDSILIDEARTPLIISGSAEQSADLYVTVDRLIPRLKREVDYTVDEKAHQAMLTDDGVEKIQGLLKVDNLYDAKNIQLVHHVAQALRAHTLYKANVNYLVDGEGKVVIIDEHTGRQMPGRRWSDGLHQAIEAKEGVTVEEESQTLATVTFQNYFRMYKKLSGMTGTADTEAEELHQIYKLIVSVIPTNKPIIRKDQSDLVYKNEAGKFRAVVADIEDCHKRGQPVLVGTVTVEKSEVVANLLRQKDIPFNVLNAKQHQREASIVAQAGRLGTVTIATNMAGRGTDILLGGNPEAMAKDALAEEQAALADAPVEAKPVAAEGDEASEVDHAPTEPKLDEKRYGELLVKFKAQCEAERQKVLAAGGLKIIGTERHESRRIDNQLRGRAGRQGDPGTSRFYLSLQDDLLRIFGLDRMTSLMERLGLEEDVPIESPMVTRSIENAQKKVEGRNFDQRKNVLEYDDVMNQQRKTIYALRRQVLDGRYHPEPTEDQEKAGITPEPVKESGDWTVESLLSGPEVKPRLGEMIDIVRGKVRERAVRQKLDAGTMEPDDATWYETWLKDPVNDHRALPTSDIRPGWRILRAEIWRQFGALLDLEARFDQPREELLTYISETVAASLVQQRERLYDLTHDQVAAVVDAGLAPEVAEDEWDWDALEDAVQEQFNIEVDLTPATPDETTTTLWPLVEKKLVEREHELSRSWLMYFQRDFMLSEIDEQWRDHLKDMDGLREGIGLQGYGQKDPKKEYKRIGFDKFAEMMTRINANVVSKLFRVQMQKAEASVPAVQAKTLTMEEHGADGKSEDEAAEEGTGASGEPKAARPKKEKPAASEEAKEPVRRERPKVGRNDPCHCGSGKKYKKCHGKDETEDAA